MSKLTGKLDTLAQFVGHEFEPSRWIEIGQDRINAFADCTEDHQFIHVDPAAAAKTPMGGTIAHGFLVLSLLAPSGTTVGLNYGFGRVRFLMPVRAGKRVRARVKIADINDKEPGRVLVNHAVTVEIEGETKPALVAEWLIAWMTGA